MPLYPYRCTQCGHKFEKIQSFSAQPETACPKCGGPLERPLTVPGLSFKGAGWYVNDYASKSSSSSSDSATESKSKSDSKPDSSTSTSDAKPAAASTESKPSAPASSTPAASGS